MRIGTAMNGHGSGRSLRATLRKLNLLYNTCMPFVLSELETRLLCTYVNNFETCRMYLICSSEHTDEGPATDTPITTLLQATSVVLILFTALSQIFTTGSFGSRTQLEIWTSCLWTFYCSCFASSKRVSSHSQYPRHVDLKIPMTDLNIVDKRPLARGSHKSHACVVAGAEQP